MSRRLRHSPVTPARKHCLAALFFLFYRSSVDFFLLGDAWRFDAGLMFVDGAIERGGKQSTIILRWPVALSPRAAGSDLLVDSSEPLRRFPEGSRAGALRQGGPPALTFLSDIWDEQKCALGRIQIVTASRAQCDGTLQ